MSKKEKKMFVYILEDWRIYWKEIKEKELENFVYYRKDDLIIVNKDYNKVKPLVRKLLEKQNILKDFWRLAFLSSIFACVIGAFSFLFLNMKVWNVEKKVDNVVEILSWQVNNWKEIEKKEKALIIENWKIMTWFTK
jgi:hypothetical protein